MILQRSVTGRGPFCCNKEEVNELEYTPDFFLCLCFIHACPVPIFPTSPFSFFSSLSLSLPAIGSAANCIMPLFVLQSGATWIAVLSTHKKHTDKLIILKKQRPGAHLAYFPRQRGDVGRGAEFRGGCWCSLGSVELHTVEPVWCTQT